MDPHNEAEEGQLTQLYFWGGHGGIGGGDPRQIVSSDCTLRFCVEEMQRRNLPLTLNMDMIPEYGDVEIEGEKVRSSKIMALVEKVTGKHVRQIDSIDKIHPLAIKRYQTCPDWRPSALESLHEELMAYRFE